jgi:hypothetical protein
MVPLDSDERTGVRPAWEAAKRDHRVPQTDQEAEMCSAPEAPRESSEDGGWMHSLRRRTKGLRNR